MPWRTLSSRLKGQFPSFLSHSVLCPYSHVAFLKSGDQKAPFSKGEHLRWSCSDVALAHQCYNMPLHHLGHFLICYFSALCDAVLAGIGGIWKSGRGYGRELRLSPCWSTHYLSDSGSNNQGRTRVPQYLLQVLKLECVGSQEL